MTQATEYVRVVVTVVRTGGLAGLRREWRAEPPTSEADRWVGLVDECPWDALESQRLQSQSRGADRYMWRIHARFDDLPPREAELGDAQLEGPWRTLVDEVRHTAPARVGRRPR